METSSMSVFNDDLIKQVEAAILEGLRITVRQPVQDVKISVEKIIDDHFQLRAF